MTKYNKTDLVAFFKETDFLSQASSGIQYLNAGGCGYFAKYLYLNIKKLGIDCKLSYCVDSCDKQGVKYLKENNTVPKRNELVFYGFTHLKVKIGRDVYIDSEGITPDFGRWVGRRSGRTVGVFKNLEPLDIALSEANIWNPIFDRSNEKVIANRLNVLEEKFKKYLEGKKV